MRVVFFYWCDIKQKKRKKSIKMGLFQTDLFNALMFFFSDLFGKLGYIIFNGVVIVFNGFACVYVFMNFFDWCRGCHSRPLSYYVSEIDQHIKSYPSDVIHIVIYGNGSWSNYYLEFSTDNSAATYSLHVFAADVGKVVHYLSKTYPEKKFEIRHMFKNKLSV